MKTLRTSVLFMALMLAMVAAHAWKPATDTAGSLTVTIPEIGEVTALEKPVPVVIRLANQGPAPLKGTLRIGVTDRWRVEGPNPRPFTVGAGARAEVTVNVVAGKGTYAAHYPIHAYVEFTEAGRPLQAHAALVVEVARAAVEVAKPRLPALARMVALRAVAPVKVDGDLAEWANAIPVPLDGTHAGVGTIEPGDFGAVLTALHDGERLYLGARVSDEEISATDRTSRDFMDSDYIRVYLAARSPRERNERVLSEEDLVLAISPFGGARPLVKVPDYGLKTRLLPDPGAVQVAARRTPGGYEAEIALPLSLIGPDVKVGQHLGLNVMLGDADGGRRVAELTLGHRDSDYWISPAAYVPLELSARTHDDGLLQLPVNVISGRGATRLDRLAGYRVCIAREGKPLLEKPLGWTGSDPETGTSFAPGTASRPDTRPCITIHPPYRGGVGPSWADARFALPNVKPITLRFATAIRDHKPGEGASDGVEWRVCVAEEGASSGKASATPEARADGARFVQLFERFSLSKTWEPATVDLSAYAGKTVTLRLWNGPGPKGNTNCDSGHWAEPTLVVGNLPAEETPQAWAERRQKAEAKAKQARSGRTDRFSWRVQSRAGAFGIALVPGPRGLVDGALAVADNRETVSFEGFLIEVAGERLGDWRSAASVEDVKILPPTKASPDAVTIRHTVLLNEARIPVDAVLRPVAGGVRLSFAMPGVTRDRRGQPRFTLLGIGPANRKARRVYAGFGNVIQEPGRFALRGNGFQLSTRHVGIDFENGVSLVQACDVFPDRFDVDPEKRLYSLQTHHDASFLLVPSARGAFAAARVYRDLAGFKPAGGVAKLKGKMCIDWWGGHEIGDDIRRAAAYGLTDSVLIKHSWQRWGYDYRLPDIYPPNCDPAVWNDWVSACRDSGILFGVHDNYIDYYPDAEGFSYKHIVFNEDGTPQRAWLHKSLRAQSYRWLPHAFKPWLARNMKLIKEGFAPTASFVDVFTAHSVIDYYDEEGRFYTKMECAKHWGECFDYIRDTLGDNAPTVSEAGHDALIGHVDGVQPDHYSAKIWNWSCADSERVPWHDMASHGAMILFAGGLGQRYAGTEPYASWGSDDYFSNTVIGGRNPMCTGPCTRDTVKTYWLLHDVCKELAHQSLETHEFVGDDIHRQHTTFGGGAQVWTNRGETPWQVEGVVLPRYGFLAKAGQTMAAIIAREGLSVALARSPGVTFVDARPTSLDTVSRAPVKTRVVGARHLGEGQVEVEFEWEVLRALPEGYQAFVHISHDKAVAQGTDRIVIHAPNGLPAEKLRQEGVHRCMIRFTFAGAPYDGDYYLRYGIYSPKGGGRLLPLADIDGTRVRGGLFTVKRRQGAIDSVKYAPERPGPDAPKENAEGKRIDFGTVVTNGAFRLLHSGREWRLYPLQGSFPFQAELRLPALGAKGQRVTSVEGLDQAGKPLGAVAFTHKGDVLHLDLDAAAFSYRIVLR
jgi:hypothetical protein